MAALEDLRAANAELAARVAAYEASEKEEKRRIEKAMDRAEQKIRAAASKVERMAKKHEDEGRELEEKRAEVARLYKDCRESRESSDKYKFEWDRSKEEVAELNDRIMRQHTEHRITQMTSEDAQEKQAKAEAEVKRLATENAALSGAGDEVVVHLAEIRAAKESEIPNFKGSFLGRFPLVSANSWTSDHLSERSRSVDAFLGTRARGTLTLKRR